MRNFFVAFATVAAVVAPQAQAETLTDALISAYRNSHLLEQQQAVLRAADEDVAVAVSSLRPVIGYTISGAYANSDFRQTSPLTGVTVRGRADSLSGTASLTAQILLYAGGRSRLGVEAAQESVLATRQALVNVEQQVLLAAVTAYVDVRLQTEIVALRESNVRTIGQELRAAQDRFEVGEVTRTDVAQAEASLALARASLSSAQGDLIMAREAYKAATGHYPGNLAPLPKSPITARNLDEARSIALRTHPTIRQLQHQVKASDISVAISKAAMLPTVSGSVGLNQGLDDGLTSKTIGLSVNQTLYGGGELSALYRQSIANKEAVRAALHQQGVDVAEAVGNAWASISVASAAIDASVSGVAAAQTAFDGVREEAKLGARTTLDVLDAELDLLTARASRLEAEANRYLGTYTLLSAMGLLTVEHLNLGIPTYDPSAYYNAVKNAPVSLQGKKLDRVMEKLGKK
ncbi:MAG: TolC family outer membrane protein [Paracoccaceae bacterium]